jgi:hypothetical protein
MKAIEQRVRNLQLGQGSLASLAHSEVLFQGLRFPSGNVSDHKSLELQVIRAGDKLSHVALLQRNPYSKIILPAR